MAGRGSRRVRQLDQPGEPAGHRGLRHGRVGPRRELPEGERRVAEPERRGARSVGGSRSSAPPRGACARRRAARAPSGSAGRGSRDRRWRAGSPRRADRRRAPVPRARARSRSRPRRRGTPRSRPSSSRRRPSASRGRSRACARRGRRDAADERRARVQRRPHLEMRRARPAQRASAEEGAAQIRRPAAGAGDDTSGRPVERQPLAPEDAGLGEDVDRMGRALDEQLRASAPVERVSAVRADLRLDPKPPQDRERPTRDGRLREVEVERSSPRPRRWTAPAVWKSAEISARRSQRRSGATAASSARASASSAPALTAAFPRARAGGA